MDYFNESGAQVLADRIKAYWAERGYDVKTWVEHGGFSLTLKKNVVSVRSDMKNGLPVRRLPGFA